MSHDLVEFGFLLRLVCAVLFYPAVFKKCGLPTDNHSGNLLILFKKSTMKWSLTNAS